jgi:hypothetical protein
MNNESLPIKAVTFSRDRAMQLEAALNSFYLHCCDVESTQLSVLFLATSEVHTRQYDTLIKAYPRVTFLRQTNFRRDLLTCLRPTLRSGLANSYLDLVFSFSQFAAQKKYIRRILSEWILPNMKKILPAIPDNQYVLFMVDDNLFTHDFSLNEGIRALKQHPEAIGFSLRLGENTTYCYAHSSPQNIPEFHSVSDNILEFDWTKSEHDFNYPLEVSSSVYPLNTVYPLLAGIGFTHPTSLEGEMAAHSNLFCKDHPNLLCYQRSVAFCDPINMVQSIMSNRAGGNTDFSIESLVERFDRGERIDVEALSDYVSNGCHQEVELKFVIRK